MKKIALMAGVGLCVLVGLGTVAFLTLSQDPEVDLVQVAAPQEQEDLPPLVVLQRPGQSNLEIYGPQCYEDGRGNDLVPQSTTSSTDCFAFVNGGRDSLVLTGKEDPVLVAISSRPASSQNIQFGLGGGYLEITGPHDAIVSAQGSRNTIVSFPTLSLSDIKFSQDRTDMIIQAPNGSVVLRNQLSDSGRFVSHVKLRNDRVLDSEQMRVQTLTGQSTTGDDVILDTTSDDIFYPRSGNDRVILRGGRNRIHYESGNDAISSQIEQDPDNTLYIQYPREEVALSIGRQDRDLILTTPEGSVTLELQLFYETGDPRVPIQSVVFQDGPVSDEQLRFLIEVALQEEGQASREERSNIRQ